MKNDKLKQILEICVNYNFDELSNRILIIEERLKRDMYIFNELKELKDLINNSDIDFIFKNKINQLITELWNQKT